MIGIAAFSEIVSLIYAAAISAERWDEALSQIHQAMTTTGVIAGQVRVCTLAIADGASRTMTGNLPPSADSAYRQHYGRLDHVLQAVERGRVGLLRNGTELIAPYTRTEFYTDWVQPNDLGDGIFVRLSEDEKPTSLIVAGSRGPEAFADEERTAVLDALVPHLRQALRTQRDLSQLCWRAGELSTALDAIEHAIVIVRSGSSIAHGNAAAELLLRRGDGLMSQSGHLVASVGHANARLQTLLTLAQRGNGAGVRQGGTMLCSRPSGQRAYPLHVVPLDGESAGLGSPGASAMVIIVDPERRRLPSTELLRRLFGLTRTEAVVARLVLNGEGLGPIADRLRLSPDTVKTHLRNIFQKTHTHRQAELVRLLLASIY